MKAWFKSGSPWIWMTAGAISLSLLAVLGLLLMIAWRGLIYFWPATVYEFEMRTANGGVETVIGEIHDRQPVPALQLRERGIEVAEDIEFVERLLIKTGNREFVPLDFRWSLESDILSRKVAAGIGVFERRKNGNFYGYPLRLLENGQPLRGELRLLLTERLARVNALNKQADALQKGAIGQVNHKLERSRLKERKLALEGQLSDEQRSAFEAERAQLRADYQQLEKELFALRSQAERDALVVQDMRGAEVTLPLAYLLDASFPNEMNILQRLGHWCVQVAKFLINEPREANTEGGVFPAIFGTIFMVLLMAIIVTPFGVIAAIYLHEYAGDNAITRLVRIAVINLAGVPSIVYGVFGLGFFVYMVGGSIDALFYPEALPSPTFGAPGVLWSALTLALLTLPVVIVSTEEGLSRIPSALRQGSLALGATKAETLWRIVIPMASPAIMTGLILAIARAAGETAPLMLVGVVKMAPTLPLDGNFPYVHLERKFMHLGFHIYDVGFQSPNVEAARPLVYATSFLLVTVIVGLNLTAIAIRNHLREKYRSLEH